MMNELSPYTLDTIAALGFDIYQSSDPKWRSYAFFVEGDGIGYIENRFAEGLALTTVHVPNSRTGTGFSLQIDRVELTRPCLSLAFMHAPLWASPEMRNSVKKWASVEQFLQSQIMPLVRVREGVK